VQEARWGTIGSRDSRGHAQEEALHLLKGGASLSVKVLMYFLINEGKRVD
jgi:hypothetical protein